MGFLSDLTGSVFDILGGDSPDTSGINEQARESAKLGRDQFEWFKQEYERTAPERDAATSRANEVSDASLDAMRLSTEEARRLSERNRTVFQPMEDQIVADANNYDTAGRRTQAVDEARTNVEQSFGNSQDAMTRAIRRTGGATGGGRAMALMKDFALDKAKAITGSTAGAVRNVEQQGYARKMDAAGLGKGILGNQATMQQVASQNGGQAVASSGAGLSATMSGAPLMQQGFSGAMQGAGQAGQLFGQTAGIESATRGQNMGLLANIYGSTLKALNPTSDETKKSNTDTPIDTKEALSQVVNTPVQAGWSYDPAKGGPDDKGRKRDGPMAQKVRATMGDAVAPDGKVIDLVSMNGRLMAGMQELNKRMARVERKAV